MVNDILVGVEGRSDEVVDALHGAASEKASGGLHQRDTGPFTLITSRKPVTEQGITACIGGNVYDAPESPEAGVAAAYHSRGRFFPRHLHGSFRVAVYDEDADQLLLATDRTGSKPIYYMRREGNLVFSSHLSILLGHPGIDPVLDRSAARQHLSTIFQTAYSGSRTLVQGIDQIHNSHVLTYTGTSSETMLYWDVYDAEPLSISDQRATERAETLLREGIRKAAACQDGPPAVMLSGGFDSTLLAALMQSETDRTVQSWTFGTIDEEFREGRRQAENLGTDHHEVRFPADLLTAREMWEYEIPTVGVDFFRFSYLRDAGVTGCATGLRDILAFPGGLGRLQSLERLRPFRPIFRALHRIRADRILTPLIRRLYPYAPNGFHILASPYQAALTANVMNIDHQTFRDLLPAHASDTPRRLEHSIDRRWALEDRPFPRNYLYLALREMNTRYAAASTKPLDHHYSTFSYGPLLDFMFRVPVRQKAERRLGRKIAEDLPRVPDGLPGAMGEDFTPLHERVYDLRFRRDEDRYRRFIDSFLDRGILDRQSAESLLLPADLEEATTMEKQFRFTVFLLELWIRVFIEREDPWTAP